MTTPKEVVRRFLDDGSGPGRWNMAVIDECFSPDYVSPTWGGIGAGHQLYRALTT